MFYSSSQPNGVILAHMRLIPVLLTGLLLACGSRTPNPEVPSWAPQGVDWNAVRGTVPITPLMLPEFQAVAHNGAERGRSDLQGKPTALWFYPAANTTG